MTRSPQTGNIAAYLAASVARRIMHVRNSQEEARTMEITRLVSLTGPLTNQRSRRGLFGLLAASGLNRLVPDESVSGKKRKQHKKKPTCGKNGGKPVKGKCCTSTIDVDGTCRRCDVCPSGCTFSSVQTAVTAASAGATIAICPGTYREALSVARSLRVIGAGDGGDSSGTTIQGAMTGPVVTATNGAITLQNLRITGGSGLNGSGIALNTGTLDLIGCTVRGNFGSAASSGGGIFNNNGRLSLTNCTVSGNSAAADGGGIYNNNNCTLRLVNTEISGNTATNGGGLANDLGGSIVFDAASRVTGNAAGANGGGIYNQGGAVSLFSSANVSGNTPTNCAGNSVAQCVG